MTVSPGSGQPTPGPPLFELRGVSLVLEGITILDDVDIAIPDSGITVLVGPSGAGKSTLLRLLNRLEVPTAGDVRFRGEPIDAIDPLALRRRVGMVFQRPAPFPGTVRDNLLVADPGGSDDELRAALDAARLDAGFLDRDADELSGGEAQRMCLARTLVTQPEALLMDEPTSSLDPDARGALEQTARRLAARGRPLVWVTHDLEQAGRLADDLVVLITGRIATGVERERFLAEDGAASEREDERPENGAAAEREEERSEDGAAAEREGERSEDGAAADTEGERPEVDADREGDRHG
jgi:putative ABC transport system ATP-binding protein